MSNKLNNPPIVEVIFEAKWNQNEVPSDIKNDSNILAGRFYDRVIGEYKYHEPLPQADFPIPEELINGMVKHRFRVNESGWPLVQIGSGIFTLNDTKNYKWDDFRERIIKSVKELLSIYPISPLINELNLRYVNSIPFDFEQNDILSFVKDNMNIKFGLSEDLFGENINATPSSINLVFNYPSKEPKGVVLFKVARGQSDGKDALIWETAVHAAAPDIPTIPDNLEEWLESAHGLAENWFLKLTAGNLYESFK